jgi:hypothetical protein
MVLLAKTDLALLADEANEPQTPEDSPSQSIPHPKGARQTPVAYVSGRVRSLDLGRFRLFHS